MRPPVEAGNDRAGAVEMSALRKHLQNPLQETQPLIVVGMHRSGTSLLVRLLRDIGIHMGTWLSRDAEAVHFQMVNRRIYRSAHSNWAQVDALLEEMHSDTFVQQRAQLARNALFRARHPFQRRPPIVDFFGVELWARVWSGEPLAWGWKDPRTSLTLPVWLDIFPKAYVVHVLRNGIDVAISIHRRAQRQRRNLVKRLTRLDYVPATLDFRYAFHLWEAYVSYVLEQKHLISPERYLEVRYEDLLADPAAQLQRVVNLAGHTVTTDRLAAACGRVNAARLDNSHYAARYQDQIRVLAGAPLLRQLGYHATGVRGG
jgi:hypothetical protein